MISPTTSKGMDFWSKSLGTAGVATQMFGAITEGMSTQKAYNRNASIYDEQGNALMANLPITQHRLKREYNQVSGAQQAMYAKAGVKMSGSPLEVALDSAKEYELDKAITDYNYKLQQNKLKNQANMERYYGKVAKRQGITKAITLLTQLGEVYK